MGKNKSFITYKLKEWSRDVTALASPLILVFVPFIFLGGTKVFYILLMALLINEILASLIKIIFPKKRPNGQTYNTILEKIDAGSFPSLHASRITLVYLTLFSNTDSIAMQVVFLLVIISVIVSRILLKKHFWIDVLGGFIIGGLIFLGFSFL
jgi:membrane-associated phospholipid phosphatase